MAIVVGFVFIRSSLMEATLCPRARFGVTPVSRAWRSLHTVTGGRMGTFKEIITETETSMWAQMDALQQQYLDESFEPDEYSYTLPNFPEVQAKPARLSEQTSSSLIRFLRMP